MKKHWIFAALLLVAASAGALTELHGAGADTNNATFQQISITNQGFFQTTFTFESEDGQDRFVGEDTFTSWNWSNGSLITQGLQVDSSATNVVTSFPRGQDPNVETVFATGSAIGDEVTIERSISTGEIIFEEHIPVDLDFALAVEFSELDPSYYYEPFNNHGLQIENVEWNGQTATIARRVHEIGNEGFSVFGATLLINVDGATEYDWSNGEARGTFKSATSHSVEAEVLFP